MDVFSKAKRSEVMAAIRSRSNRSTERRFAALLRRAQVSGWKLHFSNVIGKPDFYFPEQGIAVFVDGCFWHGCPKCFQAPRQNASFWAAKIGSNRKRDKKITRRLRRDGIRVIRLWEHDLENRTAKVQDVIHVLRLLSAPKKHRRNSAIESRNGHSPRVSRVRYRAQLRHRS
jgi:DNA mismatch endonuclease, patch repair protein